jgi:uncharacterized protein YlxP (DUF503 family)
VSLGVLTIHIHLPGCSSLKEKRRRLKPLITRLHREFNISVAEMDHQDLWQDAILACALISNSNGHTQRSLQKITSWIEKNWRDVMIVTEKLEII